MLRSSTACGVPVEFLVNERSILWDDAATEVEYYHIELKDHDVLLAEGAPAESHRDDGNRGLFDNADPPRFAAANTPHFAPVLTGGPEVDRIWHEPLDRSGFVAPGASDDPDLHLVADGNRIEPHAVDCRMHGHQGVYRFRLDRTPKQLAIASRRCVPMRMGLSHDPRWLGVALRSVTLQGSGAAIEIDYDSPLFTDGFNASEAGSRHRWTDGHALLPRRTMALFEGTFNVRLEVVGTAKYPLVAETGERTILIDPAAVEFIPRPIAACQPAGCKAATAARRPRQDSGAACGKFAASTRRTYSRSEMVSA